MTKTGRIACTQILILDLEEITELEEEATNLSARPRELDAGAETIDANGHVEVS